MTKNFRKDTELGPDYLCFKCGLTHHRLWRDSHIFLNQIELLCAVCAEKQEVDNIASYAHFHQEWECGIGNLIPARPTPEGDTFWGHTSGDVVWWYKLPQYTDPIREAARVRVEYHHLLERHEWDLKDLLQAWEDIRRLEEESKNRQAIIQDMLRRKVDAKL